MDDRAFDQWSEHLAEIRKNRQVSIDQEIQGKADSFGPELFFEIAQKSLDEVMETCIKSEQKYYEENPPVEPSQELEVVRNEVESILDFEIEAIERDKATVLSRITWDLAAMEKVQESYLAFTEELRKKYAIKSKGLFSQNKKRPIELTPPAVQAGYSSGSGGNGLGLILMFVLGLILGGAPSIYFMDNVKKSEKKFQEERSKILTEQQTLADSITVLHDSFEQLALGKIKNIPQLEKEISQTKSSIDGLKQAIASSYQKDREKIFKKIPAGDRQDKALETLNNNKEKELARIKSQEDSALNPLIKQRDVLKDLIER